MKRISCVSIILLALLAACDGSTPSEPLSPWPLQPGVWHAHRAGGQSLPALMAQLPGEGLPRQTFLDSARLTITADGRWEQAVHMRTWHFTDVVEAIVRTERGYITPSHTGWVLVSDSAGVRHVLPGGAPDSIRVLLRAAGIDGVAVATLRRQPPPPQLPSSWRATHVAGRAMPDVLYVFDPDTVDGQPLSWHIIADSAKLEILPNGRYRHFVWVSHWSGEVGGPPVTWRMNGMHGDHGMWTRAGTGLDFESHWLMGHRMTGSYDVDGVLRVQHGFSHGDTPAPFTYGR